jgi:hypothetical protein
MKAKITKEFLVLYKYGQTREYKKRDHDTESNSKF